MTIKLNMNKEQLISMIEQQTRLIKDACKYDDTKSIILATIQVNELIKGLSNNKQDINDIWND